MQRRKKRAWVSNWGFSSEFDFSVFGIVLHVGSSSSDKGDAVLALDWTEVIFFFCLVDLQFLLDCCRL